MTMHSTRGTFSRLVLQLWSRKSDHHVPVGVHCLQQDAISPLGTRVGHHCSPRIARRVCQCHPESIGYPAGCIYNFFFVIIMVSGML